MEQTPELKPCPFCGYQPKKPLCTPEGIFIGCCDEECIGYNVVGTLEQWNTRQHTQPSPDNAELARRFASNANRPNKETANNAAECGYINLKHQFISTVALHIESELNAKDTANAAKLSQTEETLRVAKSNLAFFTKERDQYHEELSQMQEVAQVLVDALDDLYSQVLKQHGPTPRVSFGQSDEALSKAATLNITPQVQK